MAESIRLAPGVVFYLLYPAGLRVLARVPVPSTLGVALARSAAVGLFAYGADHLTNLATLRDWRLKLSLINISWGTLAATGTTAWWCVLRGHATPSQSLAATELAAAPTRRPNGREQEANAVRLPASLPIRFFQSGRAVEVGVLWSRLNTFAGLFDPGWWRSGNRFDRFVAHLRQHQTGAP